MVEFGQSKPDGLGLFDTVDSEFMHHQYQLSLLQWNPGLARRKGALDLGQFNSGQTKSL